CKGSARRRWSLTDDAKAKSKAADRPLAETARQIRLATCARDQSARFLDRDAHSVKGVDKQAPMLRDGLDQASQICGQMIQRRIDACERDFANPLPVSGMDVQLPAAGFQFAAFHKLIYNVIRIANGSVLVRELNASLVLKPAAPVVQFESIG